MIWTMLGCSVAVVAIFCVAVAEFLVGTPFFEARRPHFAMGLAICGAILWFWGRRRKEKKVEEASEDETDTRVFVLADLRYWGPMLVILGVITLFIQTLHQKEPVMIQARVAPAPVVQPPPPPPEPVPQPKKAPATFPVIKLQGVIVKAENSMAIINGQSFAIGDRIGDAVLKEINRDGVTLEIDDQVKSILLD
jgi:hypothetical protein